MSVKNSVKFIKFTFKKHPLKVCSQSSLAQNRTLHSINLVKSRSSPHSSPLKSLNRSILDSIKYEKVTQTASHVNVTSSDKSKIKSKSYDRNYITQQRAINEYLLEPSDLHGLRMTVRRSANESDPPHYVYWRKDIEARAISKWGSLEKVQLEIEVRESTLDEAHFPIYKRYLMERYRERQKLKEERLSRENWPVRQLRFTKENQDKGITGESGMVVLGAIAINTSNFFVKLVAWAYTGSYSMFSEAIHSLADTINQVILAYGIHKSTKNPTKDHPYGYSNVQYVSALISGVGIFCLGAGLSVYHGIQGLVNPVAVESMWIAMGILGKTTNNIIVFISFDIQIVIRCIICE